MNNYLKKINSIRNFISGAILIIFGLILLLKGKYEGPPFIQIFIIIVGFGNIFKIEISRKIGVFIGINALFIIPFLYFPMRQLNYVTSLSFSEQIIYTILTEILGIIYLLLLKDKYKK